MALSERDKQRLEVERREVYGRFSQLMADGMPKMRAYAIISLEKNISTNTVQNYINRFHYNEESTTADGSSPVVL